MMKSDFDEQLSVLKVIFLIAAGGGGPVGARPHVCDQSGKKKKKKKKHRVVSVDRGNTLSIRLCKGCLLPLSDRRAHVAAGPRTSTQGTNKALVNTARTDAPISVQQEN